MKKNSNAPIEPKLFNSNLGDAIRPAHYSICDFTQSDAANDTTNKVSHVKPELNVSYTLPVDGAPGLHDAGITRSVINSMSMEFGQSASLDLFDDTLPVDGTPELMDLTPKINIGFASYSRSLDVDSRLIGEESNNISEDVELS